MIFHWREERQVAITDGVDQDFDATSPHEAGANKAIREGTRSWVRYIQAFGGAISEDVGGQTKARSIR